MHFHQWLLNESKKVEYAYHITYMKHLDSIKHLGLIPAGSHSNWDLKHHVNHSKEGVFFSSKPEAVRYWLSLYSMAASDTPDFMIEDKIPVLLRFRLNIKKRKKDIFGQEAFQDSWYFPKTIPPQGIEYWNGSNWVPILSVKSFDSRTFTDPPKKINPKEPELWQRKIKQSKEYPLPKNMKHLKDFD